MRRVFAFDFDGTLTTADTLIAVIRYARGTVALAVGLLLYSPMLVLMKMGLYPNWKAKQRVFSHFFRGMSEADFDDRCRRFAHTHPHLLRQTGLEYIRQVREQGHRVVVVSASVDRWIEPFFDFLPQSEVRGDEKSAEVKVRGTEIEVKSGILTGRFLTPNCYGAEKVRRLREAVPDVDGCDVVAFGDSRGDRELLAMAVEPHYKPFREKGAPH